MKLPRFRFFLHVYTVCINMCSKNKEVIISASRFQVPTASQPGIHRSQMMRVWQEAQPIWFVWPAANTVVTPLTLVQLRHQQWRQTKTVWRAAPLNWSDPSSEAQGAPLQLREEGGMCPWLSPHTCELDSLHWPVSLALRRGDRFVDVYGSVLKDQWGPGYGCLVDVVLEACSHFSPEQSDNHILCGCAITERLSSHDS